MVGTVVCGRSPAAATLHDAVVDEVGDVQVARRASSASPLGWSSPVVGTVVLAARRRPGS